MREKSRPGLKLVLCLGLPLICQPRKVYHREADVDGAPGSICCLKDTPCEKIHLNMPILNHISFTLWKSSYGLIWAFNNHMAYKSPRFKVSSPLIFTPRGLPVVSRLVIVKLDVTNTRCQEKPRNSVVRQSWIQPWLLALSCMMCSPVPQVNPPLQMPFEKCHRYLSQRTDVRIM